MVRSEKGCRHQAPAWATSEIPARQGLATPRRCDDSDDAEPDREGAWSPGQHGFGRRRRVRGLRDHRRPGEGDDVPVAVPAGAARAVAVPDRRCRGGRLDGGPAGGARAGIDPGDGRDRSTPPSSPASQRGCPTCRATSATRDVRAGRAGDHERAAPVFYLEIPPFLFGTVVKGLAGAGLTTTGRVVVEKPFGHDPASATRSGGGAAPVPRRVAAVPDRPLSSGRWASRRSSTCGSPTRCSSRSGTATTSRASRSRWPRSFGVEDRGHFYDPVGALRDVVVNHLMQVVAAAAMEPPSGGDAADDQGRAGRAVPRRRPTADPAHYVRGQYDGYRDIPGRRRRTRPPRRYAALRLDIDNWRWSGVPFFIRTGKKLPITQTELRLVFKEPPRLGFDFGVRLAVRSPTSSSSGSTRSTGVRLRSRRCAPTRSGPGADRSRHGVRRRGRRRADSVRGAAACRDDRQEHPLHPPGRGRGGVADHAAAAGRATTGALLRSRVVGPGGCR